MEALPADGKDHVPPVLQHVVVHHQLVGVLRLCPHTYTPQHARRGEAAAVEMLMIKPNPPQKTETKCVLYNGASNPSSVRISLYLRA